MTPKMNESVNTIANREFLELAKNELKYVKTNV